MELFAIEIKNTIRQEINFQHESISEFARVSKMSRTFICEALSPGHKMSMNTLDKLCKLLNLELKIGRKK